MNAEARLRALFQGPRAEMFAPAFLAKVPFAKIEKTFRSVKAWGEVRDVRSLGEPGLWELDTTRGSYPFLATLDAEGRVERLRIPPALPGRWVSRLVAWTPWVLLLTIPGELTNAWRVPTAWQWLARVPSEAAFVAFLLALYVWPQTWVRLRSLVVVALLLFAASATRLPGLPTGDVPDPWTLLSAATSFVLFGGFVALAWLGRRVPAEPVALGSVLRGGTFVAAQAGSTRAINYHVAHPHMRYAVDYLGIGRNGRHACGIMPSDPARYVIFGATVVAPLDGVVEASRNDLPDLPPPTRDPLRAAGNFVVLRAVAPDGREVRVVMAHLRQGSVRVRVGDGVRAGDPLGEVGNSGNTTEPHLHLGVTVGGAPGEPLSGEGVPFTVADRFPVRGQVVKG